MPVCASFPCLFMRISQCMLGTDVVFFSADFSAKSELWTLQVISHCLVYLFSQIRPMYSEGQFEFATQITHGCENTLRWFSGGKWTVTTLNEESLRWMDLRKRCCVHTGNKAKAKNKLQSTEIHATAYWSSWLEYNEVAGDGSNLHKSFFEGDL